MLIVIRHRESPGISAAHLTYMCTPKHPFAPGDVVRYDRSQYHCREGMAIVRETGVLSDTYWASGMDAHTLTTEEVASAELVFNLGDFKELARYEEHTFVDYHPNDRRVLTSQHGLQRRRFVRLAAEPDRGTQIENAQEKVRQAEEAVASALLHLERAREDLGRLAVDAAAAGPVRTAS